MAKVGLIGTGRMGIELGKHLLTEGHELTVWNRTPSGADALVEVGAHRVATAAEAATDQDLVITCLFGPDAVQEVVLGADLLPPGTVWLDITTVGPDDADHYAAWAANHGVRYVHGPVVGSLGPAKARKLGVYLGGAPDDVALVEPFAALWADPDRLVSVPTARAAAIGKLLANLALGVALEGLVEALRFGRAMEVDPASVIAMLKGTGLAFIADMKGQIILDRAFADTQFSVDLLAKDAKLMLAAVADQAVATDLPAVEGLIATLSAVQLSGHGDDDISAAAIPELP